MRALREACCKGQIGAHGAGRGEGLEGKGWGDGAEKTWDNSSRCALGKVDKIESGSSTWTQLPMGLAVRTQLAAYNTVTGLRGLNRKNEYHPPW